MNLDQAVVSLEFVHQELEKTGDGKSDEEDEAKVEKKGDGEEEEIEGDFEEEELEEVNANSLKEYSRNIILSNYMLNYTMTEDLTLILVVFNSMQQMLLTNLKLTLYIYIYIHSLSRCFYPNQQTNKGAFTILSKEPTIP